MLPVFIRIVDVGFKQRILYNIYATVKIAIDTIGRYNNNINVLPIFSASDSFKLRGEQPMECATTILGYTRAKKCDLYLLAPHVNYFRTREQHFDQVTRIGGLVMCNQRFTVFCILF